MFKNLLLLIFLVSTIQFSWSQSIISVPMKLQHVTVYKAGASLEHTASIKLSEGNHELVLTGISNNIIDNSVQVQLPASVTLLSVITAKDYYPVDDKNPKTTALQKEKALLDRNFKINEAEIEATENTLEMILKNNKVGSSEKGTTADELAQMATYYLEQQKKLNNELILLKEEKTILTESIDSIQNLLDSENYHSDYQSGQIILQVNVNQSTTANITLQYLSDNAGWVAAYDVKAFKSTDPLTISYKAKISQNTGIDWKDVKLKLSTAIPIVGSNAPKIHPWSIEFYDPTKIYSTRRIPKKNEEEKIVGAADYNGTPGSGKSVRIRGNSSLNSEQLPLYVVDGEIYLGDLKNINPEDIEDASYLKEETARSIYGSRANYGVLVITTKNKGVHKYTKVTTEEISATFDISIPYTILTNNKSHTVLMKEFKHPAKFQHIAIPKIDPDVYLVAKLYQFESLNLMPGEANIILNNMYVGSTYLYTHSTEDTLMISMGKDKSITVERILIPENSIIKTSGSNNRQTSEYEITIRNTKKESILLSLQDQYPVSRENNIKIELMESDNAMVNKDTGMLTWNLQIPPSGTQKLRFKYEIKYPKDKKLR